jgi:hypothetical protein
MVAMRIILRAQSASLAPPHWSRIWAMMYRICSTASSKAIQHQVKHYNTSAHHWCSPGVKVEAVLCCAGVGCPWMSCPRQQ